MAIIKQIRSNVIADDYLESIKERTIAEIFKTIYHVYGPYGENIFVNSTNAGAYHTRDGKVCLAHTAFDNSISKDIKSIFMQAVEHQSDSAGDGTTTMTLFYAIVADQLMKLQKEKNFPTIRFRKIVMDCIKQINQILKAEYVTQVERDSDEIRRTIYTTVQDIELAEIIYDAVSKSQEHTILDVIASDEIQDMIIEVHDEPRIEGSVIYSTSALPENGKLDKCAILYVDGKAELNHVETIEILTRTPFNTSDGTPYIKNIIILCDDINDTTRRTLKTFAKLGAKDIVNNLIFYRIKGYRDFKREYKNDLTAVIYNRIGLSGLEQAMTFEAHLLNIFVDEDRYKELCGGLNLADENLLAMGNVFKTVGISCELSELSGLKIDKDATEITNEMLKNLKEQAEREVSPFVKAEIRERIRKIYGNYIVLKIGSKMLKDRQRESELVLDAFVSSQRAIENGIMSTNGMVALHLIARERADVFSGFEMEGEFFRIIRDASAWVTLGIIYKGLGIPLDINIDKEACAAFNGTIFPTSSRMNIHEIENFEDGGVEYSHEQLPELIATLYEETLKVNLNGHEVSESPIEPADTILTIVENLTMPFDLAYARAFIAPEYMENYI